MKFRHELSYDASPAEVFAMLADPEQSGSGTTEVVELERLMAEKVRSGMDIEQQVGQTWLTGK